MEKGMKIDLKRDTKNWFHDENGEDFQESNKPGNWVLLKNVRNNGKSE